MKTTQILTTMLCVCTLFTLTACGKSKPSTNAEINKNDIPSYLEDYDPNYPYICNHVNNLYHLTSCPDLLTQKSNMFHYYKTEESAKQDGHTPCETCLGIGE